jgi:hypothetical protein
MPTVITCQLVTLDDGSRMRVYWDKGRMLGEVVAQPEDADRPDGDYRYNERTNRMTLITRYDDPARE